MVFDLTLNEQLLGDWQSKYASTKIIYRKLDITQKSEIEAAYKEADALVGQIDVVINGMGLMDDRHVELTIQINLVGRHSIQTNLDSYSLLVRCHSQLPDSAGVHGQVKGWTWRPSGQHFLGGRHTTHR